MSSTNHEHTFVWDGQELLPCACGANVLAIETVLGAAADDARKVAGDRYYTGTRLRQEFETLELWLFNAPLQVVQELEAMHTGAYLIHNDAPRPRTAVDDLRDSSTGRPGSPTESRRTLLAQARTATCESASWRTCKGHRGSSTRSTAAA